MRANMISYHLKKTHLRKDQKLLRQVDQFEANFVLHISVWVLSGEKSEK